MQYPMVVWYLKITPFHSNPKHIFTTNLELRFIFFVYSCCGFLRALTVPFSIIHSLSISVTTIVGPISFLMYINPKPPKTKEFENNEEWEWSERMYSCHIRSKMVRRKCRKTQRESEKMKMEVKRVFSAFTVQLKWRVGKTIL